VSPTRGKSISLISKQNCLFRRCIYVSAASGACKMLCLRFSRTNCWFEDCIYLSAASAPILPPTADAATPMTVLFVRFGSHYKHKYKHKQGDAHTHRHLEDSLAIQSEQCCKEGQQMAACYIKCEKYCRQ